MDHYLLAPLAALLLRLGLVASPHIAAVIDPLRPPSPCATPGHAAFDFWTGTWLVIDSTAGRAAGTNRISRIDAGCVIREEYDGFGFSGRSLNWLDSGDGKWHQLWLDSQGTVLRLTGGPDRPGRMVLEGVLHDSLGPVRQRITWELRSDGTVRQWWTQGRGSGDPTETVFDGIYRRLGP